MIGSGIFTTTGFMAGDLGRPSIVLSVWLVGGVAAAAGCISYAELGVNLPRSGGEYVYLREAWGPAWGFLSGWVSFFAGFSAPIAAAALAFTEYLGAFSPALSVGAQQRTIASSFGWVHLGPQIIVGVAVIAVFTIVNILGLSGAAKLQNLLTAIKLGVLAVFLALAFAVGNGHWQNFRLNTARTSPHALGVQFAVSLTFVMFAYSGWNAAAYVAEEMQSPERALPWAMVTGTIVVTLLYIALNVAFIYALPLGQLKGVVPVGAVSAKALLGDRGGMFFSAIMAVGLLSCVSAMVLVGPRVYYAMAQDGCFFESAARVHPRWQTPVHSIIYQGVATAIMVITGTFEALVYYIGFTLVLFAALATAGLFRLRKRPGWRRLGATGWTIRAAPWVFIGVSCVMLASTLALRSSPSLLGLATVACGGLFYRWKFRGDRTDR
jgi:APA family basic amino acid/polyamine antiporter